MVNRTQEQVIAQLLNKGKAIILLGARQVGKTTLLQGLLGNDSDTMWLNADEPDVQALFDQPTSTKLSAYIGTHKVLVIDEAQRIADIGIKLKLITDNLKHLQLIATGSSALELANQVNEPLTGRKWELNLYPLSFAEMVTHHGLLQEKRLLSHRLLYGYYPEVVSNQGNERAILKQLSDSYLYRDLLMWEGIKKPEKLLKLMQALALQIGSEVSYHEIGNMIGLDSQTVERYVQLLEKVFVVFRLGSFSRNLRNELKRSKKVYFYDTGIRNALIANFAEPQLRTDIGALWENFLVAERLKYNHYSNRWCNSYFWRTTEQQEIDYVEDSDGILAAYEFKWSIKTKNKFPTTFTKTYPTASTQLITPDNFESFLGT
jgi:predicted AAA+ superfamily ATPase